MDFDCFCDVVVCCWWCYGCFVVGSGFCYIVVCRVGFVYVWIEVIGCYVVFVVVYGVFGVFVWCYCGCFDLVDEVGGFDCCGIYFLLVWIFDFLFWGDFVDRFVLVFCC